ncbi:MAG: ADP-L-glycero-D-manno-heptose-6-epimerase [Nitrospira sp.]|nr:ADP-L-glycero-D-manno-heptose-6-epimerase [Nitrospira sp.]
MVERLIVTGALGHIGSALIRDPQLVDFFDEILMVDNLSTQRFPSLFNLPSGTNYRLLEGDVEDLLSAKIASTASAVVHLAAATDPTASSIDPVKLFENNLRITKHVVRVCEQTETPLTFVSTTSVYSSHLELVSEDCADLSPVSPYAQCKLEEEQIVLQALGVGGCAVFRLGTIFGISPGMRFHTAVNKFCWQAVCGSPIEVWATAMDQVRPYLSVGDAVALLSRTSRDSIYPGKVINAVSCDATVREVIRAIELNGLSVTVHLVDSQIMNELSFRTSINRATGMGFKFNGEIKSGVRETLQLLNSLWP